MPFSPIRSDLLSDKIVMNIIEQIQRGELKPGDKLPTEMQLTEMYGVSRGILREAMTVLRSRGYIRRKPRNGTYINETGDLHGQVTELLKRGSYANLIEMRECMELKIVEKVALSASDEDIDELLEMLETGECDDSHINIDHYFHFRLAELSGNQLFMKFINLYYDLIAEIASYSRRSIERRDAIKVEHLAIAKAIQERNPEKARAAMAGHMGKIAEAIDKIEF